MHNDPNMSDKTIEACPPDSDQPERRTVHAITVASFSQNKLKIFLAKTDRSRGRYGKLTLVLSRFSLQQYVVW